MMIKVIAPGDDKYEELLKGILAHLDERARLRLETPEYLRYRAELSELAAQSQQQNGRKLTDDEAFKELMRRKRCDEIKTSIECYMDDLHHAERRHREHRRQFEEALEKNRALKQRESTSIS